MHTHPRSRRTLALVVGLVACGPTPGTNPTTSPAPSPSPPAARTEAPATKAAQSDADADADAEAAERARSAPPPAGLAAGIISDFESGELGSEFGAGWQLGTDAMNGGSSTVELGVENGALRMVGTIDAGVPEPWAGAMFFPGDQAMRPANLDSKPTLAFQARGDGPLTVLVFAEHLGTTPAVARVELGDEWAPHSVDLRALVGELHDITAIVFSGPARAGKFETWVDDVRLR
jgi:hypothetical protein